MMNKPRVLVVGGGIAGTVAAIALHKAGLEPVIAEAFDVDADGVGAFLTVAPNGVRGLRLLDSAASALARSFETPRFEISLGSGRVLAEMPAAGDSELPPRTVRRSDFYGGLRREAERRSIPAHYGKRLVDAEENADGVVARFADGAQLEADLLVGADGLRSRVRALLDPGAAGLRYLGLLNTGGFARGVQVPGAAGTLHFVFGKRCFFGWVKRPDGEVWWFANPGRRTEPTAQELRAMPPHLWRAELLDLLSRDASPALGIIEATDRIIGPWPTHDLPRVKTWRSRRMVIIGDAAHAASPSSGQGASMAVEDWDRRSPGASAMLRRSERRWTTTSGSDARGWNESSPWAGETAPARRQACSGAPCGTSRSASSSRAAPGAIPWPGSTVIASSGPDQRRVRSHPRRMLSGLPPAAAYILLSLEIPSCANGLVGQVFGPPGRKHGCQSAGNSMIRLVSASNSSW